jgi:hypothetical protein
MGAIDERPDVCIVTAPSVVVRRRGRHLLALAALLSVSSALVCGLANDGVAQSSADPSTTSLVPKAPDASTTGVPAGVALRRSGSITVRKPSAVIDTRLVKGGITIAANNVTVKRTRIRVPGGAEGVGVTIEQGVTGTLIQDTEIAGSESFQGIQGGGFTARRVNIHGFEHGVEIRGRGKVLDSYISLTDFRYPDGTVPHFDAVCGWSVNGVVVRHNTLTAPPDQTAAVNFTNDFGSIKDVVIDNNYLSGGGYALYVRGDASSPGSPALGKPVKNIRVTNNQFGTSQWGHASVVQAQISASGNVEQATGLPTLTE